MLIVCSDEKYLKTPWVRNEYMRFLALIGDERKESDAITVAFRGAPIEKLEGKRGKLQGIDLSRPDGYSRIESFVEGHTPEARARREQAENRRKAEEEARQRQLDEKLAEVKRQQEETARRNLELQRELENKLRSLQTQTPDSQSAQGFAAPSALQSLLVRAKQFLEMSDYKAARDYYNRALDNMPECAEAWWGLFLTDYGAASKEAVYSKLSLRAGLENAKANRNYINAKKYATGAFAAELKDFANGLDTVLRKIEAEERAEHERQRKAAEEKKESINLFPNFVLVKETQSKSNDKPVYFEIKDGVLKKYNGKGGNVIIPGGVTSIGSYAFNGCNNLTSITIPDSVTRIEYSAFRDCSSLTSVAIPDSVTSIEEMAFLGCGSMTSITIPDSVTSIGNWAFYKCGSLTSITIPDSVTSIGKNAFFACSSLTSVTIPDSVTSIGEMAFHGCSSLASINIPNSVTVIAVGAFASCRNLKRVKIPKSFKNQIGKIFGVICKKTKFKYTR